MMPRLSLVLAGSLSLVLAPLARAEAEQCTLYHVAATKAWADKDKEKEKSSQRGLKRDKGGDDECSGSNADLEPVWLDADLDFKLTGRVHVPDVIPVTEGQSRNDWVTLEIGVHECDGSFSGVVTCQYKGGGPHAEGADAAKYVFHECSNGAKPGDAVAGNALSLHVGPGGNNCPGARTTVTVDLRACDVGAQLTAHN